MLSSLFSKASKMEWGQLSNSNVLNEINKKSYDQPILVFKHSTRCSISAMALNRFERSYEEGSGFEPYFLDLIAYRDISNEIENRYQVTHQSPQIILIKNGEAIYDASHNAISFNEIKDVLNN